MSGLEVAGVVLGSLPLIVSALEHYADGIHTVKRYWRYKSQVKSLIEEIDTERAIFLNTLQQLLLGIVRIEHMAKFLASPGGELWREAGVDVRLKERLRGSYEIYLRNVSGIERSLKRIMEKLALDPDGQPQFSDPSLFKREKKRLKFSVRRSKYAEQLNDLKYYNQTLVRLTKQSLDLESAIAGIKTRSCPNFSVLQNYARSIFETLQSGLRCSCEGHAVKLRLENRSERAEDEDDLLESTPFRVIFTYTSTNTSVFSNWNEADIRCILDKPQHISLQLPTPNATKPARQVRFSQFLVQKSSNSAIGTITEQQTVVAAKSSLEQIQDLCRTIAQPQRDIRAGYLIDSFKRKQGIFPLDTPASHNNEQKWSAYTLRQVLTRRINFSQRLTQRDKFKVAVDIASSVLQLYKTPWLGEDWNGDDVYFVQRPGAPLESIFQYPFIYTRLSSAAVNPGSSTQQPVCRVIRNQTLFTLGVLLVELLYGMPIEELQKPRDLNCQGTPGVVWCTVVRLIQEDIECEAGPLYLDAVRRCILCDFNRKDLSLDDHDFQQAVFDGIVVPLEKTLQRFNGLE